MDAQLIANTPQEEALIKIRSLQKQNAISSQLDKIKDLEKRTYNLFLILVKKRYGINEDQLLGFSDDQIEALGEIVYRQAKKRAIIGGTLVWVFGLLIPLVGWTTILLFGLCDDEIAYSYNYRRRCNQLRNIIGDKYFSAKRLREINS